MTNHEQSPDRQFNRRPLSYWLDKPGMIDYLVTDRTQSGIADRVGVSQTTFGQWAISARKNYGVTPTSVQNFLDREAVMPTEQNIESGAIRQLILDGFSTPLPAAQPTGTQISKILASFVPGPLGAVAGFAGAFDDYLKDQNISHTAAGTPVPVLSTVPAGKLTEAMRDEALGMVLSTSRKVAKGCYALRVVGDSMTAPPGSTDSFPEGCTIIIKPCDEAVHGQFVVAQNDETGEWTFKKYQAMGLDSPLLIPLNPVGHLPIDIGKARLRVVGALIESLVIKLY